MIYYLLISVKLNHAASYRYYFRFLTVIFSARAYFSFPCTVFSEMLDTLFLFIRALFFDARYVFLGPLFFSLNFLGVVRAKRALIYFEMPVRGVLRT